MVKTTLLVALESADMVVCDGCEIDGTVMLGDGVVRLDCGEMVMAVLKDQPVELSSDGETKVAMHVGPESEAEGMECGGTVNLTFKVTIPMRHEDLMPV